MIRKFAIIFIIGFAIVFSAWFFDANAQSTGNLWKPVPGVPNEIQPYNNSQNVSIPALGSGTFCLHSVNGLVQVTSGDCGSGAGNLSFYLNGTLYVASSSVNFQQGTNIQITSSTVSGVPTFTITGVAASGTVTEVFTASSPYLTVAQIGANATLTLASVLSVTSTPTITAGAVTGTNIGFTLVNTGNWAGTWQGVNSTTFYLASNPSAYISNISTTINTAAPLGGGGSFTNNSTLNLTCTGCLTGNQTTTLTGPVTGSGTTSIATTITSPMTVNVSTSQVTSTNLDFTTALGTTVTSTNFSSTNDTTTNEYFTTASGTTVTALNVNGEVFDANDISGQGAAYQLNGNNMILASTSNFNYYFAGSGNSTASGTYNFGFGRGALSSLTNGSNNLAAGTTALNDLTTGSKNVGLGEDSGFNLTTATGTVNLGFSAGSASTQSSAFYVGDVSQASAANDQLYSLLYGTFAGKAATTTGQTLFINTTNLYTPGNLFVTGTISEAGATTTNCLTGINDVSPCVNTLNGFSGTVLATGTLNEILYSNSANTITFSTPQAIGTASTVQFAGLTVTTVSSTNANVSSIAANSFVATDANHNLVSTTTPVTSIIAGAGLGVNSANAAVTITPSSSVITASLAFNWSTPTTTVGLNFQSKLTPYALTLTYADCGQQGNVTTSYNIGYDTSTADAAAGTIDNFFTTSTLQCSNGNFSSSTVFTNSAIPAYSYTLAVVTSTTATSTHFTIDLVGTKG